MCRSPTPLKIAVIYGASHLDGMYRAATQGLEGFEKAIKTIPKKILDMSSLPKARIYKPEPESNGWRQLTN